MKRSLRHARPLVGSLKYTFMDVPARLGAVVAFLRQASDPYYGNASPSVLTAAGTAILDALPRDLSPKDRDQLIALDIKALEDSGLAREVSTDDLKNFTDDRQLWALVILARLQQVVERPSEALTRPLRESLPGGKDLEYYLRKERWLGYYSSELRQLYPQFLEMLEAHPKLRAMIDELEDPNTGTHRRVSLGSALDEQPQIKLLIEEGRKLGLGYDGFRMCQWLYKAVKTQADR